MLSNFDIERICRKLELPIVGVFSKDKIPKDIRIGSYYINLQDANDGDGTHWVMFKIYDNDDREDKSNKKKESIGALYFDPFGVDMPKEVADFLKPFKPIPYSNRQIQGLKQEECGWYCIACDYSLEHKQHGTTYLDDFHKFISLWSDSASTNLKYLKSLFKPL
jgi:hypothetical protein